MEAGRQKGRGRRDRLCEEGRLYRRDRRRSADIAAYAETQTGKSLVNDSKVIAAVITDVQTQPFSTETGHQTLFITVEADASFTGNVYKVGPQEVRVGYEYILKTSEFELTGLICALEVTDG